MERLPTTPHDAVFRQMLMQKEVARDFLALHMPEDFLAICDLDSLKLESGVLLKTIYAAAIQIFSTLCIPNTAPDMFTRSLNIRANQTG